MRPAGPHSRISALVSNEILEQAPIMPRVPDSKSKEHFSFPKLKLTGLPSFPEPKLFSRNKTQGKRGFNLSSNKAREMRKSAQAKPLDARPAKTKLSLKAQFKKIMPQLPGFALELAKLFRVSAPIDSESVPEPKAVPVPPPRVPNAPRPLPPVPTPAAKQKLELPNAELEPRPKRKHFYLYIASILFRHFMKPNTSTNRSSK